jgi:hypothetical protein
MNFSSLDDQRAGRAEKRGKIKEKRKGEEHNPELLVVAFLLIPGVHLTGGIASFIFFDFPLPLTGNPHRLSRIQPLE